ncbi:hypothetical protein LTR85_001933 [Meristemomyces frigidus]|nr:hypothetical protein LTR85_001933 [Meristemomyces frigidus]
MAARDFFDFFGLARELRDQIYDDLLLSCTRSIKLDEAKYLRGLAVGFPTTNLALGNRQFSQEYVARSPRHAVLTVADPVKDKMHAEWARQLVAQMPGLRSTTVDAHISRDVEEPVDKREYVGAFADVLAVEKLSGLEVFDVAFPAYAKDAVWDYSKRTGPVMKWVPETGAIEDVVEQEA